MSLTNTVTVDTRNEQPIENISISSSATGSMAIPNQSTGCPDIRMMMIIIVYANTTVRKSVRTDESTAISLGNFIFVM